MTFFLQTQDKKMKTPCFYFFFHCIFLLFTNPSPKKKPKGERVTFLLNDDGNNNGSLAWQWCEHGCCKNTKWQWQHEHGCCRLNTRPKHTHKNKKYLKRNSIKKKSHCNFFFVLGDEKIKHTQKMAMARAWVLQSTQDNKNTNKKKEKLNLLLMACLFFLFF
jgi:hypothetical protein